MSYDIRVKKCKDNTTANLSDKHDIRGGTYCIGGTTACEFNITYNYSKWYYDLWPVRKNRHGIEVGGIRTLYGKSMKSIVRELTKACKKLKGMPSDNYWDPTEGNAKKALEDLLELCTYAQSEYPDEDLTLEGD